MHVSTILYKLRTCTVYVPYSKQSMIACLTITVTLQILLLMPLQKPLLLCVCVTRLTGATLPLAEGALAQTSSTAAGICGQAASSYEHYVLETCSCTSTGRHTVL
jgi:hypothetical protein